MVPFMPFAWDQVQHIDDHGINIKYVGKYISVENVFQGAAILLGDVMTVHTHLVLVVQELFRENWSGLPTGGTLSWYLVRVVQAFFPEQELCI